MSHTKIKSKIIMSANLAEQMETNFNAVIVKVKDKGNVALNVPLLHTFFDNMRSEGEWVTPECKGDIPEDLTEYKTFQYSNKAQDVVQCALNDWAAAYFRAKHTNKPTLTDEGKSDGTIDSLINFLHQRRNPTRSTGIRGESIKAFKDFIEGICKAKKKPYAAVAYLVQGLQSPNIQGHVLSDKQKENVSKWIGAFYNSQSFEDKYKESLDTAYESLLNPEAQEVDDDFEPDFDDM